jgi:GNAT superfamily N-acetyltransferase
MKVEVKESPPTALEQLAAISIAFEVRSVFDVEADGEGFALNERPVEHPYLKDYDAIKDNDPHQLSTRFALSNWRLFIAQSDDQVLGGALVVFDAPELELLERRKDLALLWDLRVRLDARRHGIGSALLRAAESWAQARGCKQLCIETQNINVPACKFYQRHGYVLTNVNAGAYPQLPHEIQLIWSKSLST